MEVYSSSGSSAATARAESAPVRVLLCDDNAGMLALLRVTFGLDDDIAVIGEAATGMEAIFQAGCLQPDLVLLDLAMPVMDGLTAIPEIRRIAPDAKILVFTGFESRRLAQRAEELGAHGFVEKGIPPHDLARRVVKVAGERVQRTREESDALSDARVFKEIFGNTSFGIGIGDDRGRPVFVNPTLERMLGYDAGELDGVALRDITHPEDLDDNLRLLDELVAGKRLSFTYEKRYLRKDGAPHRARVTASLLRSKDKTYSLAMIENLSGRR